MKIFGITGRKNSGKTDLVVRLVAHFTGLGLRVATVKHAHCAAETDRSGTDSHRHRAAGAAQVVLSTPDRWALMTELRGTDEPSLKALIDRLDPCDLVLVEGFKSARIPKIECHRPATGQPLLGRIYAVSAIAAPGGQVGSDLPDPDAPVLDLDDTAAIARFIQDQLAAGGARAAMPSGVDWLPVDEAQARLRAALTPLQGAEDLPIAQAAGRVLAQDAVAVRANPPRANSAVDGYGYAAAHAAPTMPLTPGRAAAGAPFSGTVPAGQALRILTGAILPEGVDTVALQEDAHHGDGTVRLDRMPKPGANTRPAGEDLNEGATALPAGRRLTRPIWPWRPQPASPPSGSVRGCAWRCCLPATRSSRRLAIPHCRIRSGMRTGPCCLPWRRAGRVFRWTWVMHPTIRGASPTRWIAVPARRI